jgi:hypothetical protein
MFENVPDLSVAEVRHLIDEGMRRKCIDARDPTALAVGRGQDPG